MKTLSQVLWVLVFPLVVVAVLISSNAAMAAEWVSGLWKRRK